jgi:hypothetical protein
MARRQKRKRFRAVTEVKALARERIGTPRPEQVVPDRRKKARTGEKHKATLGQLLQENE